MISTLFISFYIQALVSFLALTGFADCYNSTFQITCGALSLISGMGAGYGATKVMPHFNKLINID